MLTAKEVKDKLHGKIDHWYFGYDRERWNLIVPHIKKRLIRELWEVTLWDRLLGRDIPNCERCRNELLDVPRFILTFPLCEECYQDYHADKIHDRRYRWGESHEDCECDD